MTIVEDNIKKLLDDFKKLITNFGLYLIVITNIVSIYHLITGQPDFWYWFWGNIGGCAIVLYYPVIGLGLDLFIKSIDKLIQILDNRRFRKIFSVIFALTMTAMVVMMGNNAFNNEATYQRQCKELSEITGAVYTTYSTDGPGLFRKASEYVTCVYMENYTRIEHQVLKNNSWNPTFDYINEMQT